MALTIGELVGYLRLDDKDWDTKERKARRGLADLADGWERTGDRADRAALAFLNAANNLSNIPTAAQAIAGTATLVAQMSGALLLLPAAGAAAGTAFATLKIGLSGFGDALKNVGDPEKFAESLKTLAPNARDAAIAIRDLKPAWDEVRKTVQDELFSGVAKTIKQVGGTYMPILKRGLKDVAAGFDDATLGARKFLMEAQTQRDVAGIFRNTSGVVAELSAGLHPLLDILRDVAAVGMEMLPGLTDGFGSAAQRAADFVHNARETGQLKDWISDGLNAIGDLVQLLKNLGSIAATIFGGLNAGGANLIDTLINVTDKIKTFLKSFEGQQALKALGQALNTVSMVVTDVMLTAFRELAPVVVALAPGFAELAKQVGSILVDALTFVGPLLAGVAKFLSDNASWVGPLAIGMYGLAKALDVVRFATVLLTAAAAINPWVIIIAATITLVTLIVTHWDEIKAACAAAWNWIKDTAALVWEGIKVAIINPITDAARWIGDRIQDIIDFFNWLGELPGRVGRWFNDVKTSAIQALIDLVNWVAGLPGRILDAIGDLARLLWNAGRDVINGLIDGMKSMVNEALAYVQNMGSMIENAFSSVMGIFSPSRVFANLGRQIPAGLALGIQRGMSPVDRAIQDLAARSMIGMDAPGVAPTPAGGSAPFAVGGQQRALVHIDTFNATPEQAPDEIAYELDWASRGAGY